MFNVSDGPWYIDLAAIAGALTSIGIIWRMVIGPGLKTFWSAITAAPKIADGVGKVVELIEGDVLNELSDMKSTFKSHLVDAAVRDDWIAEHEQRLGKLEDAVFHNQKGC